MKMAKEKGLTGKSYVWIATQSVIGETREALPDFPAGMLGNYTTYMSFILTRFIFSKFYGKVGVISWLLFHLI